ncbi:MAG: DUF2909 family protein [Natronospirillum sp.]
MLKILIAVLTIAMIAALATSFRYLWREDGSKTLRWLWWRVGIAVALLAVIVFGALTGELTMQAPWHGRY